MAETDSVLLNNQVNNAEIAAANAVTSGTGLEKADTDVHNALADVIAAERDAKTPEQLDRLRQVEQRLANVDNSIHNAEAEKKAEEGTEGSTESSAREAGASLAASLLALDALALTKTKTAEAASVVEQLQEVAGPAPRGFGERLIGGLREFAVAAAAPVMMLVNNVADEALERKESVVRIKDAIREVAQRLEGTPEAVFNMTNRALASSGFETTERLSAKAEDAENLRTNVLMRPEATPAASAIAQRLFTDLANPADYPTIAMTQDFGTGRVNTESLAPGTIGNARQQQQQQDVAMPAMPIA